MESPLGVHAHPKKEVNQFPMENAEIKSKIKTAETSKKGLLDKKIPADKEVKKCKMEVEKM